MTNMGSDRQYKKTEREREREREREIQQGKTENIINTKCYHLRVKYSQK